MKLIIKKGTTSKILRIFISDRTQVDGRGKTGIVYNTANFVASYIREGDAAKTQIVLVNATVGTYTSSGFKEIDAAWMPGMYELHIPDACLANGADSVVVMLQDQHTLMAPLPIEIQLDDNTAADVYSRVGAPAGASIAADLVTIDNFVDELESRLSAARAGYLDNLSAGAVALASVCTNTRLAELDAANLPTDIADIPTVAEFNARTLLAASYFDPAADAVANVTLVATTTTNTDMVGTSNAALAATALTNATWTNAKAAFIDAAISSRNATTPLSAALTKTEVVSALADIKLDHLINIAVDTDWATTVHLDSVIGHMADVGTAATFNRTTDALEALRNRGDAAWVTATGFGAVGEYDVVIAALQTDLDNPNQYKADVANLDVAVSTRAPANEYDTPMGYIPANLGDVATATEDNTAHGAGNWEGAAAAPTVDQIADAVWDEDLTTHTTAMTGGWFVKKIKAITDAILAMVT